MRKIILSAIVVLAAMQSLSAQKYAGANGGWWADIQVSQNFGINKWSGSDYANDGFPRTSLTELRAVLNYYLITPSVGAFFDMGLGVMPAPRMRSFDAGLLPMPDRGKDYFIRHQAESGVSRSSAHFRMSVGFFGEFYPMQRIAVMPYAGVGMMTMTRRTFDVRLKENGSNMEYDAHYVWGRSKGDEYGGNGEVLGYFTGRLNFRYELNPRTNLLLGLEYTHSWNSTHFYADYRNAYNGNLQRSFSAKCNKMNMLGVSVGVSFR